MKFTFLVDPSSVIITIYLVCLFYAWELVWTMHWSREEKFFVKIGPVVLEKMLMQEAQQTTDNNGREPIAIGHLSDSGDLKNIILPL